MLHNPAEAGPRTQFDGRWFVVGIVPLYMALFFAFSPGFSVVEVAQTWGIVTQRPLFSDAYVVPAAVKTLRAGGDPYVHNPFDPWQRRLNYPPVWLLVSPGSTAPAAVKGVALAQTGLALAALLLVLGRLTPRQGLVTSLLGCSPPVLLGVERGNNDQLVFALVGFSLWILRRAADGRRAWAGYAMIGAAALLKLYPLAGFAVLVRESGAKLRRHAGLALALALLGLAINAPYLAAISANTATGGLHSYGATVVGFWLEFFGPGYGWRVDRGTLDLTAQILALLVGAAAVRWGLRGSRAEPAFPPGELDALRAGTAVYAGTFVLGSNFDYRLPFLFLCLPALFRGLGAGGTTRRDARLAMAFLALTLWPNGVFWKPLLLVKLGASWGLLFTLIVFAARTLPTRQHSPHRARG